MLFLTLVILLSYVAHILTFSPGFPVFPDSARVSLLFFIHIFIMHSSDQGYSIQARWLSVIITGPMAPCDNIATWWRVQQYHHMQAISPALYGC